MGRVAAAVILRAEAVMEKLASDPKGDPMEAAKAIASLADSLGKARAASKGLMAETDKLAVAMGVVKALTQFIQDQYPQHLAAFAEVLEPFGREVVRMHE